VLENIRPQKQKYVNHGIDVVVEITKSLGCFKIFVRIDDAVIHGTTAVTSFEYTDSPLPSMAVDTYKYVCPETTAISVQLVPVTALAIRA